jgi:curli biogenesis system outer membrane secretion channel CsgG
MAFLSIDQFLSRILLFIISAIVLGGCSNLSSDLGSFVPQAGTETKVTSAPSDEYTGPKSRIAVSSFTDKTRKGWYSRKIGDGMADQLITALVNTNRFSVVERQNLKGVMEEIGFGQSGMVDPSTAAKIGKVAGADLIVTAAVTEFEGNVGGSKTNVKARESGMMGALGGLMGGSQKAHMAIDLRITDVQTSEIIAASSVEGTSKNIDFGAVVGGFTDSTALGGALNQWENTPIEKALREVINKSVEFIQERVPNSYFRYSSKGGSSDYGGLR